MEPFWFLDLDGFDAPRGAPCGDVASDSDQPEGMTVDADRVGKGSLVSRHDAETRIGRGIGVGLRVRAPLTGADADIPRTLAPENRKPNRVDDEGRIERFPSVFVANGNLDRFRKDPETFLGRRSMRRGTGRIEHEDSIALIERESGIGRVFRHQHARTDGRLETVANEPFPTAIRFAFANRAVGMDDRTRDASEPFHDAIRERTPCVDCGNDPCGKRHRHCLSRRKGGDSPPYSLLAERREDGRGKGARGRGGREGGRAGDGTGIVRLKRLLDFVIRRTIPRFRHGGMEKVREFLVRERIRERDDGAHVFDRLTEALPEGKPRGMKARAGDADLEGLARGFRLRVLRIGVLHVRRDDDGRGVVDRHVHVPDEGEDPVVIHADGLERNPQRHRETRVQVRELGDEVFDRHAPRLETDVRVRTRLVRFGDREDDAIGMHLTYSDLRLQRAMALIGSSIH